MIIIIKILNLERDSHRYTRKNPVNNIDEIKHRTELTINYLRIKGTWKPDTSALARSCAPTPVALVTK